MFLNASDFLRSRSIDALCPQGEVLSQAERYAEVVRAKKLRNFWFTSTLAQPATTPNAVQALSFTPRFSEPVILTDIISLLEVSLINNPLVAQITRYGGEGNAYGRDLFGLSGAIVSSLLVKHEHNRITSSGGNDFDTLDRWISIVPHLIRPFETLKIAYDESTTDSSNIDGMFPHLGFRGVRVIAPDSAYAQLNKLADTQVRDYIQSSKPEMFLLEVRTTLASLGAINTGFVQLRTAQQDRPLLILGAASNLTGAQMRMEDESGYYRFTYQEAPANPPFTGGNAYTDPPLSVVACDTDFRNTQLFNMWPVPHVLEPGAVLKIRLNNGCFPDGVTGALTQAAATRNSQDVRITFVCRTP